MKFIKYGKYVGEPADAVDLGRTNQNAWAISSCKAASTRSCGWPTCPRAAGLGGGVTCGGCWGLDETFVGHARGNFIDEFRGCFVVHGVGALQHLAQFFRSWRLREQITFLERAMDPWRRDSMDFLGIHFAHAGKTGTRSRFAGRNRPGRLISSSRSRRRPGSLRIFSVFDEFHDVSLRRSVVLARGGRLAFSRGSGWRGFSAKYAAPLRCVRCCGDGPIAFENHFGGCRDGSGVFADSVTPRATIFSHQALDFGELLAKLEGGSHFGKL